MLGGNRLTEKNFRHIWMACSLGIALLIGGFLNMIVFSIISGVVMGIVENNLNFSEETPPTNTSSHVDSGSSTQFTQSKGNDRSDQQAVGHGFCPHCGKPISFDDSFCKHCGTKLKI